MSTWAAFAVGMLLIVIGVSWLLVLTFGAGNETVVVSADRAPPRTTPPPTPRWGTPVLIDNDLGSGSGEFSAIAFNESTNRVMIADDEGWLYEFDLAADGKPMTPPRRTVRVAVGAGDIEGLAWMFGSTYVLAHENDGQLTVVELADDVNMISAANVVRTVDTGIREERGNGLEGVTYLGPGDIEFAVVDERPPTVVLIDSDGAIAHVVPIDPGLPDVSDVWADPNGNLVVLSDEARVAITLARTPVGTLDQLESLDLVLPDGRFEQPEGIVGTADGGRLFVVGEAPGPGRYSFGVWTAEPAG